MEVIEPRFAGIEKLPATKGAKNTKKFPAETQEAQSFFDRIYRIVRIGLFKVRLATALGCVYLPLAMDAFPHLPPKIAQIANSAF